MSQDPDEDWYTCLPSYRLLLPTKSILSGGGGAWGWVALFFFFCFLAARLEPADYQPAGSPEVVGGASAAEGEAGGTRAGVGGTVAEAKPGGASPGPELGVTGGPGIAAGGAGEGAGASDGGSPEPAMGEES